MSLTARPKPKPHMKKRQAMHHRQSKHYLKTYYPFLPLFAAVIGVGMIVNKLWQPASLKHAAAFGSSPLIGDTRLGTIIGNTGSNMALYIALLVTFVAFAVLIISHTIRLHKLLVKSEAVVVKYPWADLGLVVIIVSGIILTRA